jgi:hypothetical protein
MVAELSNVAIAAIVWVWNGIAHADDFTATSQTRFSALVTGALFPSLTTGRRTLKCGDRRNRLAMAAGANNYPP